MAYHQQFKGILYYSNHDLIDFVCKKAFSNKNIKPTDFEIKDLLITINRTTHSPATLYDEYSAALSILASCAYKGEVRATFEDDDVEIIKPIQKIKYERKDKRPKEDVKPLTGLRLKNTVPLDAFKVDSYYRQLRTEEYLQRAKYFQCSNCQRKTLIKPEKMIPDWPYEESVESCFDLSLKLVFDENTKDKKKLTYDFYCKGCNFPIRLVFNIEISRSDLYYPRITNILEKQKAV